MYSDAPAALANTTKLGHELMRHVMVSSVYVKDCVVRKQVMLAKVSSELNLADLNTKYVERARFEQLWEQVGSIDGEGADRPKLCSLMNSLGDVEVIRTKEAPIAAIVDNGEAVAEVCSPSVALSRSEGRSRWRLWVGYGRGLGRHSRAGRRPSKQPRLSSEEACEIVSVPRGSFGSHKQLPLSARSQGSHESWGLCVRRMRAHAGSCARLPSLEVRQACSNVVAVRWLSALEVCWYDMNHCRCFICIASVHGDLRVDVFRDE